MERVAGAPSLPVLTERDQRLAQLQQMLRDSELTPAEYRAAVAKIMAEQGPAAAFLEEAGWSPDAVQDILAGVERREGGLAGWAARTMNPAGMERSRRAAAEGARFDRSMEEFDRNLGLAMGQIDPEGQAPLAQPVAPEDEDQYWNLSERERGTKVGAPWGGGAPFKNDYARDRYYERPPMDTSQEAEMREAGVPEADIRRGRMSPQELDMLRSGDQGWVNVYADGHDGRAVPRQRAPKPSAMRDDGTPNPTALFDGNADLVTGGAPVGDAVDNRDRRDDLRNESLEAQGYVPTPIRGPNGIEWVYEQPADVKDRNRAQTQQYRERKMMARLRARAGAPPPAAVAPPAAAPAGPPPVNLMGAPADEADRLRDLIDQTRESDRLAQREAFLKSRMNPRMRAETGLAEIGQPGMNDWQNFVLAQNLAANADPTTPLAADAFMNQQMLRGLQSQMQGRGFNGNDPMAVAMFQAQQEERRLQEQKMETWRAKAASYIDSPYGNNAERARAAVLKMGAPPDVADMLIAEMFPEAGGGSPAAKARGAARRSGGSAWTRPGDPIPSASGR
jgi:hypothetical protein